MSDENKLKQEQENTAKEAANKRKELFLIRDFNGEVVYNCTEEEFEKIIVDILTLGTFNKTFPLLKGKIELTYQTVTDQERSKAYELLRKYTEANKDNLSGIEHDSYTNKVNVALQLIRVKNNCNITNLGEGTLDERIKLLEETPELQLILYAKWLRVFSNLTSRAFNYEDTLKNL